MDFYLDIQVEPDLEITAAALLNNLFAKFHRTMAQHCLGEIAVSFPRYHRGLGDVLRLHGTQASLKKLMAQPWLKGLRDYTCVSEIRPVPTDIKGYRTVFRVQQKSPQNIRKRSVAKGWLSAEEALLKFSDEKQKTLNLPYLQVKSLSSDQMIKIFVRMGDIQETASQGEITTYGLSRSATIPWF